MFNKRILAFALFLALCLFACGACAFDITNYPGKFLQGHLSYSQDNDTFILIQPLGSAYELYSTTSDPSNWRLRYSGNDINAIKSSVASYGDRLANSTAGRIFSTIGYSGNPSVADHAPVWSKLGTLDHMKKETFYYLDNGQGFKLSTKVALFDLSLLANSASSTHSFSHIDSVSLNNITSPFSNNARYLSFDKENLSNNIFSDFPKPGPILSASIIDITGDNGNWDETNTVEWLMSSSEDGYSFNDRVNWLRLINSADETDENNKNLPLSEIIKKANEHSSAFFSDFVYAKVEHFSPYAFVWTEIEPLTAPLAAPDVPQTGDSSSLAPWLLLLGGACALLLLAKKKSAASA